MTIDTTTVQRIAHLARLELKPDEEQQMVQDLSKILHWMEQLDELDTSTTEPLMHLSTEHNVQREDLAIKSISREEGLKNAPKSDKIYFKVPKVLE